MASEPDNDWTASSPMPDEESRQILLEWNETTEPYDQTAGIHELFERQALENPDAPAAECNGLILTYSELNTRANCLAAALAAHGVKPEAPIGLCVERSPNMLVGLLGILKSGAAYVPLDPAFPRERLTTIVRDADIRFLITEEAALAAIPQTDAQVISLDAPEATPARLPLQKSGGRSLAYIIYTSGSTGVPKGVQIEHRSVVNLLLSAARKLELTKRDRLLAVTTLSFDIAGLELFMPLVTGGTVIIAKRDTTTDGPALANLLETSRATVMQATPSTWRMLIEAGWKRSPGLKAICGGEALSPSLANELRSRCREVWNFYGPTETTIWSTACKMDDADFITIGRPLANTQAYILDAQMSLMPVGAIGELLLGGLGLARGYWNREALTSERFIPHPFMPGERVYRTGDLARFLPDGRIECLGRMDHQVKIRGYRIELGDVESALGQHGKVRQALVTALEDKFGDKRLTAYVVPKNGSVPLLELRSFLAGKLPAYMVPAHFIQLKELPMTPNGKVDHRQLPRPEVASEAVAAFVSPVGQTEISLSEIWQQVLSVPRVGAEDNFFDLGADSLSATRAYARIIAAFGPQITLREIFDKPTIRSLAKTIAGNNGGGAGSSIKRQPRVFLDLPSARR